MRHEIIELHDVQIIGLAKQIAFNEAKEECPKQHLYLCHRRNIQRWRRARREEMGQDSSIIKFKRLPKVPKALCMKHVGPYERFYESFTEAFRYIEEQGYKVTGQPRTCYIDGPWNQDNPEKWLSVIQIPIE
jgi:hypothetical protein